MNGSSGESFKHSHFFTSNRDAKRLNQHEEIACTDTDEFPRAVARTAVAQICEAKGFHSIQLSALETLADIAIRFLCDTGKASQFYANLAGRTQSNALDVLCAVEDTNGNGLTHAHRATATSDIPSELKRFVDYIEEIPFCKPLPHFPIRRKQASIPSFSQVGEKPPGGHIPPWLPAFPDVHTYKTTPIWNERKVDPRVDKLEQAKQRRKAAQSLVSLHSRLSTAGASSSAETTSDMKVPQDMNLWGFPVSEPLDVDGEGAVPRVQNPLVSAPLPKGPAILPSFFEAFAPALEADTLTVQETNGAAPSPRARLLSSDRSMPLILTFDFGRRANQKAIAARVLTLLLMRHGIDKGKGRMPGNTSLSKNGNQSFRLTQCVTPALLNNGVAAARNQIFDAWEDFWSFVVFRILIFGLF
ncbi:hypothetical protein GOP47_0013483 [Adiantum capillus-veneris]|uniref:Transcription initiation factor TFIID subunit 8 n=1 Tax=Adiantum capillus-veneris TaxID=13818 RepID=A0A9D4UPK0_ADICA|nr:hypothetical protein GOP47_0013483 [Adiantum capillus-veneris]